MKRYILFQFDSYYPEGGIKDMTGSFDSMDEIKAFIAIAYRYDHAHIFDIQTGKTEYLR